MRGGAGGAAAGGGGGDGAEGFGAEGGAGDGFAGGGGAPSAEYDLKAATLDCSSTSTATGEPTGTSLAPSGTKSFATNPSSVASKVSVALSCARKVGA